MVEPLTLISRAFQDKLSGIVNKKHKLSTLERGGAGIGIPSFKIEPIQSAAHKNEDDRINTSWVRLTEPQFTSYIYSVIWGIWDWH